MFVTFGDLCRRLLFTLSARFDNLPAVFRYFSESNFPSSAKLTPQGKPLKTKFEQIGGIMKKVIFGSLFLAIAVIGGASSASAQMMKDENPLVGGAAMYKTKNIVENAVNSK